VHNSSHNVGAQYTIAELKAITSVVPAISKHYQSSNLTPSKQFQILLLKLAKVGVVCVCVCVRERERERERESKYYICQCDSYQHQNL